MVKIHVLKPFVFTRRAPKGLKVPVEQYFKKGEHEIDQEMASHPFISKHFADGCIESPAQALVRAKGAAEIAEKASHDADQANEFARQAYERTVKNARQHGAVDEAAIERELNTPINELGSSQGESLHVPVSESESAKAGAPKAPETAPESVPASPAAAPAKQSAKKA